MAVKYRDLNLYQEGVGGQQLYRNGVKGEIIPAGSDGVPYGGVRYGDYVVYGDGNNGFYTEWMGTKTPSDIYGNAIENKQNTSGGTTPTTPNPAGDTQSTPVPTSGASKGYNPSDYAKNTVGTFDQYLRNNAKLYGELLDKQKQYANDTYESAVKYADEQAERDRAYYTTEAERGRTYYDNQLAEAQRQNEIARQRAAVDADSAYRLSRATYGTDAEALGRMGLSGSGYGSYADSQAYLASRQQKVAADAEANAQLAQVKYNVSEGKYGVDQAERAGLYNVESNLGAAKYNADQTRRQTLYGAEEEYTKNIMANEEKRATYNEAQREKAEANRAAAAEKVEAKLEAEKAKAEAELEAEKAKAEAKKTAYITNKSKLRSMIDENPSGFNKAYIQDYFDADLIDEAGMKELGVYADTAKGKADNLENTAKTDAENTLNQERALAVSDAKGQIDNGYYPSDNEIASAGYNEDEAGQIKQYRDDTIVMRLSNAITNADIADATVEEVEAAHDNLDISDDVYHRIFNNYAKSIIPEEVTLKNADETIKELDTLKKDGRLTEEDHKARIGDVGKSFGQVRIDSVISKLEDNVSYETNGKRYTAVSTGTTSKKEASVLDRMFADKMGKQAENGDIATYGGKYYVYTKNGWHRATIKQYS